MPHRHFLRAAITAVFSVLAVFGLYQFGKIESELEQNKTLKFGILFIIVFFSCVSACKMISL
jgi:hypothetical protein